MSEPKQTNFRIGEEAANSFRQMCNDLGMNQAQGFDHLIQIMELNKAKTAIAGRLVEIETFEEYTKKILETYMQSLEIANNTEERIREEFKRDIALRDKAISDYEQKVVMFGEQIAVLKESIISAENAKLEAEKNAENAVKQSELAGSTLEEMKKVNSMLTVKLTEAEEKVTGYAALQSNVDELQQQLAAALHANELLMAENKFEKENVARLDADRHDAEQEVKKLQEDTVRLNNEVLLAQRDVAERERSAAQMIDDLKREHIQNVELAVEKAVHKAQTDMQEQLAQLRDEKVRLELQLEMLQSSNKNS